jgi:hypothetical protein
VNIFLLPAIPFFLCCPKKETKKGSQKQMLDCFCSTIFNAINLSIGLNEQVARAFATHEAPFIDCIQLNV